VWGEEALEGEGAAFGGGEGGAFAVLGFFEEDGALEGVVSLGVVEGFGGMVFGLRLGSILEGRRLLWASG
jgi:hypothetical protein